VRCEDGRLLLQEERDRARQMDLASTKPTEVSSCTRGQTVCDLECTADPAHGSHRDCLWRCGNTGLHYGDKHQVCCSLSLTDDLHFPLARLCCSNDQTMEAIKVFHYGACPGVRVLCVWGHLLQRMTCHSLGPLCMERDTSSANGGERLCLADKMIVPETLERLGSHHISRCKLARRGGAHLQCTAGCSC